MRMCVGELALAQAVGVLGLAQQHPVPEAGAVLAEATVELVVHGALAEEEAAAEGLFHSALIISTLID